MPRFFFDSRVGDKLTIDEVGVQARDVEAAKRLAATAITEMGRDEISGDGEHQTLGIDVRSQTGSPLLTVWLRFDVDEAPKHAADVPT